MFTKITIIVDSLRQNWQQAPPLFAAQYWLEWKIAWPGRMALHAFIDFAASIAQVLPDTITSEEIDRYVSFTRFMKGADKVACDWCAIVNGFLQLFLDRLHAYFRSPHFDYDKFMLIFLRRPWTPFAFTDAVILLRSMPNSSIRAGPAWSRGPWMPDTPASTLSRCR